MSRTKGRARRGPLLIMAFGKKPMRTILFERTRTTAMPFASPVQNLHHLGLSAGMRVADFGAGAGHYAVAASDLVGESGEVYVIEIQEELLTKAKTLDGRPRRNLHFIRGDIEKEKGSGLADGQCDAVILSNVLFMIEHKDIVATEAYRVLTVGGTVLVIDWADSFGGIGPTPEHVYTQNAARELFQASGFTFQKEFDAGDHHWGLTFRK